MTSEAIKPQDVWLLPGWQNSDADHWQSLWQEQFGFQRLEQHNWQHPLRGDWSIRLQETVLDAPGPVMLVAHSLACVLVAWWAAHSQVAKTKVRGALLVAPADTAQESLRGALPSWAPVLLQQLPFPSILVASENDPHCSLARAQTMADGWGSRFVNAGAVGHINTASGLGLWDDGLALLKTL